MKKILMVDDSASIRALLAFTLKSQGHTTMEAENGQDGLEKAQSEQFDLIVSDVNMPFMNGIEFATKIRALDNYKYTPILMLTTESSAELKSKGKAAGVTGWIVKPFDPQKIIAVVNKVLP